jgi:hypothetical protein
MSDNVWVIYSDFYEFYRIHTKIREISMWGTNNTQTSPIFTDYQRQNEHSPNVGAKSAVVELLFFTGLCHEIHEDLSQDLAN